MRVRSPLLAQSLNCFLFLQVLRCFSSLSLLLLLGTMPSAWWVAPFGNLRIYRLFAPPRSLSQLITSFFASESLGIPHTPLLTSFNDSSIHNQCDSIMSMITLYRVFLLCARLNCSCLATRPLPQHTFVMYVYFTFFTTLSSVCQ